MCAWISYVVLLIGRYALFVCFFYNKRKCFLSCCPWQKDDWHLSWLIKLLLIWRLLLIKLLYKFIHTWDPVQGTTTSSPSILLVLLQLLILILTLASLILQWQKSVYSVSTMTTYVLLLEYSVKYCYNIWYRFWLEISDSKLLKQVLDLY